MRYAVRFPKVADLRDLNLGLAWSVHGDLNSVSPIQTGSDVEGSHTINSLKNEQG